MLGDLGSGLHSLQLLLSETMVTTGDGHIQCAPFKIPTFLLSPARRYALAFKRRSQVGRVCLLAARAGTALCRSVQ
jgi:hypothetical protein